MAAAAICSGYHFRWPTNAPALTSFRVDLKQGGDDTVIVDLAAQSWPKYLLQPGRVSVRGQMKATGDLADRQTSLLITMASSNEKISVRPSARNMTATDNGYSYEVSLNSSPKPNPGRRGQAQGMSPKPNLDQEQGSGMNPKPNPDRRGLEQEQSQRPDEQGLNPNPKPNLGRRGQTQGRSPKPNPDREQDSGINPKPNPDRRRLDQEQSQRQGEQGLNPSPKPKTKPKPSRGFGRMPEPGVVPLSFELSIPYLDTIKRDIGSVTVRYTDNEQGSLQGQVTFIIRNSHIGAK